MSELKNCPFCGGEAKRAVIFGRNGVECRECLCMMRGWLDATPEEIAKQWNTRVPMQKIVERLEDVRVLALQNACLKEAGPECYDISCETCYMDRAIEIVKEEGGLDV